MSAELSTTESSLAPLVRVNLALAAAYAVSLAALLALGRRPAVPWTFGPFLVLLSLPTALALAGTLVLVPARMTARPPTVLLRLLLMVCGVGLLALSRQASVWPVAGIVATIATVRDWTLRKVAGLTLAMLGLVTGFATVWNLNYVLAILTKDRILDAGMVRFDSAMLSALLGPTSYIGLFPIVRMPWLFNLLEASYFMLFAEILLVSIAFAVRRSPRDLAAWLCVLFGTYGIGLAVFACVPLVGPNTYRPDSFDATYHASLTFQAMNNIAAEYVRVLSGRPLSGFGYFVAVPSLHVAVATLAQRSMRATPWLFWTLLPVNLLLVSSTVLLGFHYLIDVPAGLMLGLALGYVLERRTSVPTPLRNARGSDSTRQMPA